MQLKKYTDYALRVFIFVGMKRGGERASINEISDVYCISHHHLRKIVVELNEAELIDTVRGRYVGLRLKQPPNEINIGDVVRRIEQDFTILECFDREKNHCIISLSCKLTDALILALESFLTVLDEYTLDDLIVNENELLALMGL